MGVENPETAILMENSKNENINNLVIDLLNRHFDPADIKDELLQKRLSGRPDHRGPGSAADCTGAALPQEPNEIFLL